MSDPLRLSATGQVARMRAGRLSAEALMEATLARIEAVNGVYNAVVSMRDPDVLMDKAHAADAGEPAGALHGLPVAIKDLADVRGLPTSQGSPVFAGQVAEADSFHVARMRAAGAIFIGKTNTPEFGLGSHTYNPVHGATCNAYDRSVSCGGSSGGAAVALAHGMVSLADGSDMMGSLRNPAGWNNVYGLRPSLGRVPKDAGDEMYLHQLSTNGPMGRAPADLALLLGVMEGRNPRVPGSWGFEPVAGLVPDADVRIGWLGDWGGAWPFEDGIQELCHGALSVLEAQGARVEDVAAPFSREALWEAWVTLRAFANAGSLAPLMALPETRDALKPEAVWEAETGLALSAAQVQAASAQRSAWFTCAVQLLQEYDVFALPTAQVWPFALESHWPREIAGVSMDTYHRWMEVVIPASLIGLPAVAVPAGFGASGLPMGVQIIGGPGCDQQVLNVAEAYHRATDWPGRRPAES